MKSWILTLFLLVFCGDIMAQPVSICDDEAEWPPYIYYSRVNGKPDKSKLTGATVELFDEVFKLIGMKYSIQLRPWKRCLMEVHRFGQNQKFEVFTNGSFSMERADKYYISTSIYETHKGVFYSKKQYPNGLPIRKLSDLNNFDRIDGVLGYTYEEYKLNSNKNIYQGAPNISASLKRLSSQRCDILLSSLEPVYGGEAIAKYIIPPDIDSMVVPGIETTTFHMFVSKSSPRAYELVTRLNQAILILQHNGVSKRIFRKYLSKE